MRRLAYPDVPPQKIHEMYQRSLRKPIHAYGFYVDPVEFYLTKRGYKHNSNPPLSGAAIMRDVSQFLGDTRQELIAAGLHSLSIASIPIPRKLRKSYSSDESWLVILGTGFNKTPHAPISDEFVQRVQGILQTEEKPAWWSMKIFEYPPPKPWIDFYCGNPTQPTESAASSEV